MLRVAWLAAPILFYGARAASLPHMPGTSRYIGYNCFEGNGGHRLELGSDYANPFPDRFPPEECYQRCMDDHRCQGFQIVRRHVEAGHPAPGPCWLRTNMKVEGCLKGAAMGAEPYDLFVIADRTLHVAAPRYDDDRVVRTRDYSKECRSSKYNKVNVKGLKGYGKWGNGEYLEMGTKCEGSTYWRKKGDDAYIYRVGDKWYIGDHVCSTSKYWANRRAASGCPMHDLYTADSELGSTVKLSSKKSKPKHTSTWVPMANVFWFVLLPIAIIILCVSLFFLFGFSKEHSRVVVVQIPDPTPDLAPAAPKPAPQPYVPAYRPYWPDPNSFTTVESVRLDKSRPNWFAPAVDVRTGRLLV